MTNNWNDLNLIRTFCKVAELGSFSKAARAMNQPKSRVSRTISKLEQSLNVQLIRRTTRSFSLTDQGRQFYQRVHPLLDSLYLELDRLDAQSDDVAGPIRITAPDDVGQHLLADVIQAFAKLYPNVSMSLELSNTVRDLTAQNIDVAFRIGRLKDSSYIQSRLTGIQLQVVASESYLAKNGKPLKPEDLLEHRLLLLQMNKKPMALRGLKNKPNNIFTCTNFPLLYQLVKSDFGVGVIPDFYCRRDIQKGVVQQFFPDWKILEISLHMVYPSRKNLPKRVRLFMDFAKEEIQKTLNT